MRFHIVDHLDEVLRHALELDDVDGFFARAREGLQENHESKMPPPRSRENGQRRSQRQLTASGSVGANSSPAAGVGRALHKIADDLANLGVKDHADVPPVLKKVGDLIAVGIAFMTL